MKIHEYQAKELLHLYGVPTQKGFAVESVKDAEKAAQELNCGLCVVKAQIHSGGRGKAGGVKLARSVKEAGEVASKILGATLVTPQTGPQGKKVHVVLVTGGVDIAKEYYLSIAMDNDTACPVVIASAEGGTEIEETAHARPDAIIKELINPIVGCKDYHGRNVARRIGIPDELTKDFIDMLKKLYKLFIEKDCSLVEINPLVLTKQNQLLAIDAKMNFDDNALGRHPDIVALRDIREEDAKEAQAAANDLSYVSLDGNIGCMVNGAGLAMATMDIIKANGGEPANFLDVGGSATTERVTAAFKILLSDKNVKAILVNIFGGIMKCDVIAEGIIAAAKEVNISVPVIARLDGTNVKEGKEILNNSGIKIIAAADLGDAARLSVKSVQGAR